MHRGRNYSVSFHGHLSDYALIHAAWNADASIDPLVHLFETLQNEHPRFPLKHPNNSVAGEAGQLRNLVDGISLFVLHAGLSLFPTWRRRWCFWRSIPSMAMVRSLFGSGLGGAFDIGLLHFLGGGAGGVVCVGTGGGVLGGTYPAWSCLGGVTISGFLIRSSFLCWRWRRRRVSWWRRRVARWIVTLLN